MKILLNEIMTVTFYYLGTIFFKHVLVLKLSKIGFKYYIYTFNFIEKKRSLYTHIRIHVYIKILNFTFTCLSVL